VRVWFITRISEVQLASPRSTTVASCFQYIYLFITELYCWTARRALYYCYYFIETSMRVICVLFDFTIRQRSGYHLHTLFLVFPWFLSGYADTHRHILPSHSSSLIIARRTRPLLVELSQHCTPKQLDWSAVWHALVGDLARAIFFEASDPNTKVLWKMYFYFRAKW
jgi:hypothetical protein